MHNHKYLYQCKMLLFVYHFVETVWMVECIDYFLHIFKTTCHWNESGQKLYFFRIEIVCINILI